MTRGSGLNPRKEALLKIGGPERKEAAQRECAAFPVRCASEKYDRRLAVGHFLGHVQNEFAIPFFHFAQQAAKLVEKACIFANAAPGDVIG